MIRPPSPFQARGFTLIEVVVAVAILAISLTVYLETQAASLANAGRSRDLTVATLLTRSKMIDVEKRIVAEGFTTGDVDENGNFRDEGHEEITWEYTVSEIELDLSSLDSLVGGDAADHDRQGKVNTTLTGGLAGSIQGLSNQMSQSLRAVELTVTWPMGRFKESMHVHALLTREDFGQGAGSSAATPPMVNPAGIPGANPTPALRR